MTTALHSDHAWICAPRLPDQPEGRTPPGAAEPEPGEPGPASMKRTDLAETQRRHGIGVAISRLRPIARRSSIRNDIGQAGIAVALAAGMRRVALLVWLAACGDAPHTSCPPANPNGMACAGSLSCTYAQPGSRTQYCVCFDDRMWCSDCNTTEYGFGSCTTGEHCDYSSWETDCSCACTASRLWNCTSDDAVSPCPRNP